MSGRSIDIYLDAQLQVDALLDRIRQTEPCGFCAPSDDMPPPISPWLFWPAVVAYSLILTVASYELATRLIPWIRSHS